MFFKHTHTHIHRKLIKFTKKRMFQKIVIQKVTNFRRINNTVCRLGLHWQYRKQIMVQEIFYIGLPCFYFHQSV